MIAPRLLEVVSGLGLGGAERALLNRIKYLPLDFDQVVLNVRPEIDALQLSPSIAEYRIDRKGFLRLVDIFNFLSQRAFDVIIVRTPIDAIRLGIFKFLVNRDAPKLVFEAHSNFVSKKRGADVLLRILLRLVSGKIDLIVAVSQNVSRGPLCIGHKNVHVVHLGGEFDRSVQSTMASDYARLIFVGRLVELKRPIWLLERIRTVHSQQALPSDTLTIVGSGPLKGDVEEFIESHNLQAVVRYVGEKMDVAPYLLASTHLVSTSTNEGLPLTFFEAKLAGLAIIATPSGGGAEIFGPEDKELKSFNEKEFEEALTSILFAPPPTPELRKKIQLNSHWMRTSECSKRYYSLIKQLL